MNYVENSEFIEELKKCKEQGDSTERIGEIFFLIATRYAEKGSFSGYSWKDDMISDAVYTCLRYMHNFDITVEDPNPFAYFSLVIHRSFISYLKKQKKHSKIKDLCYNNSECLMPEFSSNGSEKDFFNITGINYQPIRGKGAKRKKGK